MSSYYKKRDITYVGGVGPKKAPILQKELGINNADELLNYFPYRYVDRSQYCKIRDLANSGAYVQIRGQITRMVISGMGRVRRLSAIFTDGEDTMDLIWFQGIDYVVKSIHENQDYIIFGKPAIYNNRYQIAHPEIDTVEVAEERRKSGGLQGMYNTTEKMKKNYLGSTAIRNIIVGEINKIMPKYPMPECLPQYLIDSFRLISHHDAIIGIHCPKTNQQLADAKLRLKFEELLFIELKMARSHHRMQTFDGLRMPHSGKYIHSFYHEHLPFPLTGAQKRVLHEIFDDVRSGRQMNRLLQGDVGSGKTLVAALTMLIAADNGYQSCLMVPTEILSNQHLETLCKLLLPVGIRVSLLTGSTKQSQRKKILEALENGEIDILVGTHAMLNDKVKFKNLGMVVIDEQHRFGVAQRAKLWSKNDINPHILVMTATPIPRTLAMTLYGDLSVSIIDELPPGRKPIHTTHQIEHHEQLFQFMRREIAAGRQVYVVYPLIAENEKMDLQDLESGYEQLCHVFPKPQYSIAMVHGRMKAAEKDSQMQRFVSGEAQILVSTTVIEVGVNVPNASVMVIENADRFGLSQLHQLRGRVGRGADQSYCILVTKNNISRESMMRMNVMTSTTDGFQIAEADLRMRGEGDIEGTQQSGSAIKLKIANIATDTQLVQYARDAAIKIIDADPELEANDNAILREELEARSEELSVWGSIS